MHAEDTPNTRQLLDACGWAVAEAVDEATRERGIRAAFDFAGVPAARAQATAALGPDGVLVLAGLTPEPITAGDSMDF